MDFQFDATADGRPLKILLHPPIVDSHRGWVNSWGPVTMSGNPHAVRCADRLNVPDAARLRPFIALLADGVDCRDEAMSEYARRHEGADVPTTILPM